MSIPPGVVHAVFDGALPGGETWQSGFWLNGSAPTAPAAANDLASLLWDTFVGGTAGTAFGSCRGNVWSPGTNIKRCRVYSYPTGGPGAGAIGEHVGTPVTGASTPALPNQICLVLTLRTALPGRANRGRMYIPFTGGTIDSGTGNTSDTVAQTVEAAFAGSMTNWNTASEGKIAVVSRTATHTNNVVSVSMDTRPDVQRRRANQQTITSRQSSSVT